MVRLALRDAREGELSKGDRMSTRVALGAGGERRGEGGGRYS